MTGLDTHPAAGTIDFGHLFLTSSMDWTVKLWSLKENRPLYSFEDNGDYVYDVAWSPQHPALFATVDGTGNLDLWNLNSDTEVATASVSVEGTPALNRVSWTQSGLHVTAGDDQVGCLNVKFAGILRPLTGGVLKSYRIVHLLTDRFTLSQHSVEI